MRGAVLIAAFLVAAVPPTASGRDDPARTVRTQRYYGPFGETGRVATTTRAPGAAFARLQAPGLALNAEGDWVRWRLRWSQGALAGAEGFERADPATARAAGWSIPAGETAHAITSVTVPGERGCHIIGASMADGVRLGAWNCESAAGTILGVATVHGEIEVLARLPQRYQGMVSFPVMHSDGREVTLAAYDPSTEIFELLQLGWRPLVR